MRLIDKVEAIEAINGMIDENGYIIPDNFAKQTKKIIFAKEIDLEEYHNEIIDKFKNKLLLNDVIDKSVIKRVAEQMKYNL